MGDIVELKIPRYIDISLDIAKKIKQREIKEGTKLKGRSLAAAQYNVSAETIRKSFILLADRGIIEVREKSGSIVISRSKAIEFIAEYKKDDSLKNSLETINDLMRQKKDIESKITHSLKKLQSNIKKRETNLPFEYVTIEIHDNYSCVGKKVLELNFFEETGATLFGIISNNTILSYVNPEHVLNQGDVLYFSGEKEHLDEIINRIKKTD